MNSRKYYDHDSCVDIEISIDPDYSDKITILINDMNSENHSMALGKEDIVNLIEYLTELARQI